MTPEQRKRLDELLGLFGVLPDMTVEETDFIEMLDHLIDGDDDFELPDEQAAKLDELWERVR